MADVATGAESTATDTGAAVDNPATATDTGTPTTEPAKEGKSLTEEAIEKIVQSRVDKITAKLGKEKAEAEAALEQMKKDKMSADQLAKYELEQEKKSLAEQKKELAEKTNRLLAVNELTKVELYDGGETGAALLNLVVNGAKEEAQIAENVKALKSVIDKLVSAQVQKTFKDNGRVPNGGGKEPDGENKENSIAAKLGKEAAERAKSSNDILNHYYRRNK